VSGEAEDTAEHGHGVSAYGQTELAVLGVPAGAWEESFRRGMHDGQESLVLFDKENSVF